MNALIAPEIRESDEVCDILSNRSSELRTLGKLWILIVIDAPMQSRSYGNEIPKLSKLSAEETRYEL
ncbi:uncharacterized protein RCO7_15120 [Rhynchosporium graminicola]|uniref:Uncharacterized protein n=1 Tax=Rhynchosporium graminicola TaxID=2792576 RepID=A0A1E1LL04_9HELO|nr:uncharacterized protein RCO7_15120 [Rhynchosporium commune]